MGKSIKSENAKRRRLKEGRLLTTERTKQAKAEARLERVKIRRINALRKYHKKKGSTFKKIAKTFSYQKKLSDSLLSYGNALGGRRVRKQGTGSVGRPRGDFKHRDPKTGQPIPATVFYRRIREFRRQMAQQARLKDIQQIQQYAKRGIPPQEAQQIVNQKQIQEATTPQVPQQIPQQAPNQFQQTKFNNPYNQQPNIPQGMPVGPNNPTLWRGRRGVVGKDMGLFGPRQVVFGLPESFFN